MKLIKSVSLLAVAAVLSLTLVACGGEKNPTPEASNEPSTEATSEVTPDATNETTPDATTEATSNN